MKGVGCHWPRIRQNIEVAGIGLGSNNAAFALEAPIPLPVRPSAEAVIFYVAFHMNTNLMLNTCHPYRDFKTCCF